MRKRRGVVWSLSGLLVAGALLAVAPSSAGAAAGQAAGGVKAGGIVVGPGSGPTGRPKVVIKADSTPLRVGGILVDGTYAVETRFFDPNNSADPGVPRKGSITVEVTRTETYSDGTVYGKGDATVNLDGVVASGSVLSRSKGGRLEVFEVNALYRVGEPADPNRARFYFSTSNCPVSCRTVENSVLTRFKGGSSQSVPREDGNGQRSLLGQYTAIRTS